ncbi:hypothetical protein WICPIJ_003908 [Wickerhamomyces pijperi]|uniref:Uncharacterized protein n=1 Tax=Wickerhamomyces pijperi TaxID=599730 RepID=A0A9P8TNB2_WICPI|nr:hypothetical protein WICPIJ_003908 [Wickerhamomyces pijperi]
MRRRPSVSSKELELYLTEEGHLEFEQDVSESQASRKSLHSYSEFLSFGSGNSSSAKRSLAEANEEDPGSVVEEEVDDNKSGNLQSHEELIQSPMKKLKTSYDTDFLDLKSLESPTSTPQSSPCKPPSTISDSLKNFNALGVMKEIQYLSSHATKSDTSPVKYMRDKRTTRRSIPQRVLFPEDESSESPSRSQENSTGAITTVRPQSSRESNTMPVILEHPLEETDSFETPLTPGTKFDSLEDALHLIYKYLVLTPSQPPQELSNLRQFKLQQMNNPISKSKVNSPVPFMIKQSSIMSNCSQLTSLRRSIIFGPFFEEEDQSPKSIYCCLNCNCPIFQLDCPSGSETSQCELLNHFTYSKTVIANNEPQHHQCCYESINEYTRITLLRSSKSITANQLSNFEKLITLFKPQFDQDDDDDGGGNIDQLIIALILTSLHPMMSTMGLNFLIRLTYQHILIESQSNDLQFLKDEENLIHVMKMLTSHALRLDDRGLVNCVYDKIERMEGDLQFIDSKFRELKYEGVLSWLEKQCQDWLKWKLSSKAGKDEVIQILHRADL